MNKFFEAITELSTTGTKAGKQQILKEHENTPYFKLALKYLLNIYDVVGISTKKLQKELPITHTDMNFDELIEYLHSNPTGKDETVSIVKGYISQFESEHQKIMMKLIAKTLTLGVSAKSVNKVYGDGFIPTFDVQLAFPYEKHIDKYTNNDMFYVTKKLDGHRAITLVKNDEKGISITSYTRRGQEYEGLKELHSNIIEFIRLNPIVMQSFRDGFMLDGELLLMNRPELTTGDLFKATAKVLKTEGEKTGIKYHVFDMTSLSDFLYSDVSTYNYEYRRTHWLDNLVHTTNIEIIPVLAKINKSQIPEWSDYATQNGWEGVMLNASTGFYRKKRSPQLLKVKKMHTADLEIVGFNQALSGEFEGGLQSLNVRLDDENIVQVGSGLTKEQRIEIWNNKEDYLGVMVEIQYFEETTNQNGGKSLRFPVFKTFRYDKTPDDANVE